jgi:hypothetical protein
VIIENREKEKRMGNGDKYKQSILHAQLKMSEWNPLYCTINILMKIIMSTNNT